MVKKPPAKDSKRKDNDARVLATFGSAIFARSSSEETELTFDKNRTFILGGKCKPSPELKISSVEKPFFVEPSNILKAGAVSEIEYNVKSLVVNGNRPVTLTLGQLAGLLAGFDRNEPGAIERFCMQAEALDSSQEIELTASSRAAELPLPTIAPERWAHRKPEDADDPVKFIRRVYGPWIGKGLHTGIMQKLDDTLLREYKALPKESVPESVRLPSYGEWIRERARLGAETPSQANATYHRERRELKR